MDSDHDAQTQWAVYDANVQAYRGLSVTTQSLLLAVGAIVLDDGDSLILLGLLFLVAMTVSWYVFFPPIFARTAIVDFHKYRLGERFSDKGGPLDSSEDTEPLREKRYAEVSLRGHQLRRRIYGALTEEIRDAYGPDAAPFRTLRPTRLKFDLVLPLLISLMWIGFLIAGIHYQHNDNSPSNVLPGHSSPTTAVSK